MISKEQFIVGDKPPVTEKSGWFLTIREDRECKHYTVEYWHGYDSPISAPCWGDPLATVKAYVRLGPIEV